jgi:hypothetical protein
MRDKFPPYKYLTAILAHTPDSTPIYYYLWICPHSHIDVPKRDVWERFNVSHFAFEIHLDLLREIDLVVWTYDPDKEIYAIILTEMPPPGLGKTLC